MKRHNNYYLIILIILFSVSLIFKSSAQNISNETKLKLIGEYKTHDELLLHHKELKEKKAPIIIGDEFVDFYGDNPTNIVKKIKKIKTSFTSEDIAEFNNPKRTRRVSKIEYSYKIIDNQALFVTERKVLYNTKTDVNRSYLINSKLYNTKGELIAKFGSLISNIKFSSDGNYFVAYHSGVNPSDTLFFYNSNGKLLNKQKTNSTNFKFSSDGKYVKVSSTKGVFLLYSSAGNKIIKINFRKKFQQGYFYNCFISDNMEYLLFSTFLPSAKVHLVNVSGEVLWEQDINPILNAYFINNNNNFIIYTIDKKKGLKSSKKSIKICSINNGKIIDEINDCKLINFHNNKLIIKKGGVYYEYEVI